MKMTISISLKE
jgi:hypothetical protein